MAACPRDRCGGRVAYCEPHQIRWTRDRRADPGLDEARWRRTTSPVVVTGQVSLAGMPPLITAQVLYGLQQRTRSGAHTRVQVLRLVVEDLRHAQADSVHADGPAAPGWAGRSARVLTALARHAALALSDPETEKAKDVWELAVFGLAGRLTFTAISQPWLRQAAKRWAADELPRRRGARRRQRAAQPDRQRGAPVAEPARQPTRPRRPTPPSSDAATSNRSCTGWPTWSRPASAAPSCAPRPAGTSSGSSAGSVRSG